MKLVHHRVDFSGSAKLRADNLANGLQYQKCQAKKETPSGNMDYLLRDIERF